MERISDPLYFYAVRGENMKHLPTIGIVPLYDMQRDSFWMVPGYMEGILAASGLPLMLPFTEEKEELEQLVDQMDGILFPGGQDIQPARYGQKPRTSCGEICRQRDEMEWKLLQLCRERCKPAFGICRGLQLMNVVLGGTLYQHLPEQLIGAADHHMTPPYDRAVHMVSLASDSLLQHIVGKSKLEVNSYHHQGICRLAPPLVAAAWAPDGLTEAVEDPNQPFFLAVQWHPEFSWEKEEDSRKLFQAFVTACSAAVEV